MSTREQILESYIEHLNDEGHPPASVHRFCKNLGITEKEFFTEFPSLDTVESAFWEALLDRVIHAVESGPEWAEFGAKQRLLAFLFAFCEEALNQRSLLLHRFGGLGVFCKPRRFAGMERRYKVFVRTIIEHGMESGEIACRGRLGDLYPEGLWIHFRGVIDYNLKDESKGFERTDAFIEKSVAVAFDLIRTQALDSAFDLAKFLLPGITGRSHS